MQRNRPYFRNHTAEITFQMKFIVNSTTLLKHLSMIDGVVVSKPIIPILNNFLFDIKDGE
jgi:hypothetical protein